MKKYILFCLIFVSCGQKDKYREDYGIITSTNLAVSSKHMGGYGRSQCLLCHNASLNIHRRVGASITPEAIALDVVANGVENTCLLKCHTGNGL
jgi:hypothetical protein